MTWLSPGLKLNYSKKWYENHIALEGDAEVGAGTPPGHQEKTIAKSKVSEGYRSHRRRPARRKIIGGTTHREAGRRRIIAHA
jgi:hypothetical protein